MKKSQHSAGVAQAIKQWFWGQFSAPHQNEVIVKPKKSVATTHMRLLKDAAFEPNQMEQVNDLINRLQNLQVSPLALLMMGLAMANGQHLHDANLTFADINGGHYRYSYASSYSELVNCADQFKSGAAGVIVTALDFVKSTVFYSGNLTSGPMIAMLEYHTGSNVTQTEMNKIMGVVAPAVKQINDNAESANILKIGLPVAIISLVLLVVAVAAIMRCVCRHRRRQYVDFSANIRDSDKLTQKEADEQTAMHNDL